jgi:hypothetical protein
MERVMVDIETFSTAFNGVIRSIGAVVFNSEEETVKTFFECGVSIESCLWAGLKTDDETIEWWRKQTKEVREQLMSKESYQLETVLASFNEAVQILGVNLDETEIWSHGSTFDIVILESAYKAVGLKPWWKYKNVRDTRTLFAVADYKYEAKGGHDALEDANRQAEAVILCLNKLKGGKQTLMERNLM